MTPIRARAVAPARFSRAVTTVSTSVFQAAQERHWPSQRRKSAPHAWQTKRLWVRAMPDLRNFDGGLLLRGPDHDAVVRVGVDLDRRARRVAAEQEVLGEDVLDGVLDGPSQRTCPER